MIKIITKIGIKIDFCRNKLVNLDELFETSASVFKLGTYMNWKSEDYGKYGWFFYNELFQYKTNKELKALQEKFGFKEKLEKDLNVKSQHKIKILWK